MIDIYCIWYCVTTAQRFKHSATHARKGSLRAKAHAYMQVDHRQSIRTVHTCEQTELKRVVGISASLKLSVSAPTTGKVFSRPFLDFPSGYTLRL
eukprot:m.830787 g.830787  ORF g.830787 m.830787 type:complete len:95 (+) comp23425_c1_seq17:16-300(+)